MYWSNKAKKCFTLFQNVYYYIIVFFIRDKTIRIFIFGDYAFLCAIYGLSGASGKGLEDKVLLPFYCIILF